MRRVPAYFPNGIFIRAISTSIFVSGWRGTSGGRRLFVMLRECLKKAEIACEKPWVKSLLCLEKDFET